MCAHLLAVFSEQSHNIFFFLLFFLLLLRDEQTDNIVYVNGLIDPWHKLSVTTKDGQPASVTVIVMSSTAHCANMYPASPHDPKELTEARAKISTAIGKWL